MKAVDRHSLHPPFVYHFYCAVIKSNKKFPCFAKIERIRSQTLKDDTVINIQDLGSGSRISNKKQRTIKSIAKSSLSSPKFSRLLFRIANHFKPETILELGTSLGINTLYLASHSSDSKIITLEGCPETAAYARKIFQQEKKTNIELIEGNIDRNLPLVVGNLDAIDMVYFDANHQFEATISYFETALTKAHPKSVFVFDDIHWSVGMEKAWKTIKKHPSATLTIDIFDAGLVFFDRNLNSTDYILEF